MHVKVFFDDKPLFLCDTISPELEHFTHQGNAFFIDEFSSSSVNTMINEMKSEKVQAGVFCHHDLEVLKKAFWEKFEVIQAAGGIVRNEDGEILFIHRRGKWDLPKGKLDDGETLEQCAVREVKEETGLQQITLNDFLLTTYHTYQEKGRQILKESYWYRMTAAGTQPFIPQAEEDILEAKWVKKDNLPEVLGNTYASIREVVLF